VPKSVLLARKITDLLLACPSLTKKLNGVVVDLNSWPAAKQCLFEQRVPNKAINLLEIFKTQGFEYLQCVHFVVAATNGSLPSKRAAKNYCFQNTAGYNLNSDWDNLKEGDIIASSLGEAGHVAIISLPPSKNSQGGLLYVEAAEAVGTNGVVQYRRINKDQLVSHYCGYLRKK